MNDKNVYILGAGFSKELGLPVQDEFLLKAQDVYFSNPSSYKHFENISQFRNELSKMRDYLSYPLLNLENLFNLLEMRLFYSSDSKLEECKDNFIQMIIDVLKNLSPNPISHNDNGDLQIDHGNRYSLYLNFLKTFLKKRDSAIEVYPDTIITFNYDLIIETAVYLYNYKKGLLEGHKHIYLNAKHENTDIEIGEINNFFSNKIAVKTYANPTIKPLQTINLLKLHGSINWKAEGKPFIVPPTWYKTEETITKLWELAYKAISEAKRIIFIGYSLPETDTYVKSLLALGINQTRNLQNIYFINPDKSETKNRCLNLLDNHFKKYCEYKEWTFKQLMDSGEGRTFIGHKLERNVHNN